MKAQLHGIYGGVGIPCVLAGLKYYLVRAGLFESSASFLDYPLNAGCRDFIERHTRRIHRR